MTNNMITSINEKLKKSLDDNTEMQMFIKAVTEAVAEHVELERQAIIKEIKDSLTPP